MFRKNKQNQVGPECAETPSGHQALEKERREIAEERWFAVFRD